MHTAVVEYPTYTSWSYANFMKLNINKTGIITFTRETSALYYVWKVCYYNIARADTIKDLGVHIVSKMHFHEHAFCIFSKSVSMLGLIRAITSSFSNLDWLSMLYITLVRQHECASVIWNSIKFADVKKLDRVQRKYITLCQSFLFSWVCHLGGFS